MMTLFDFLCQFLQFSNTENYVSETTSCDAWEEMCCLVLMSDSSFFIEKKEREGWILIDSQSFCIATNIQRVYTKKKRRSEITDSVYIHSLRFIRKNI